MPHLNKLHTENKDKGLVLIGVHSKNGGDKALAARAQLKGAYSWFSQGFDCDDLVEARNVLEEFPIL